MVGQLIRFKIKKGFSFMVFRFYYSLATWEKYLLKSMDMIDNQIKKLLRRMILSCGR